MDLLKED